MMWPLIQGTLFTFLTLLAVRVHAETFSPHITSPAAGDVWIVGTNQTVTWYRDGIPSADLSEIGVLMLGHKSSPNDSEHLMFNAPLATQFPLSLGQIEITVPDVDPLDDYIVVLFGNSGNASPKFTIVRSSTPSSTDLDSATDTATIPIASTASTSASAISASSASTTPASSAPTSDPTTTSDSSTATDTATSTVAATDDSTASATSTVPATDGTATTSAIPTAAPTETATETIIVTVIATPTAPLVNARNLLRAKRGRSSGRRQK